MELRVSEIIETENWSWEWEDEKEIILLGFPGDSSRIQPRVVEKRDKSTREHLLPGSSMF